MAQHITLGREGEALAERYLRDCGFEIVDRNWRCSVGEVDIVAFGESYLVFVEVKTRTSAASGHPLDAITPRKIGRMQRVAFAWLEAHPHQRTAVRLDAIGILLRRVGDPVVLHVTGLGE